MGSIKLVIFLRCILMAAAGPTTPSDQTGDSSNGFQGRIVNGRNAHHEKFPFLVSIQIYLDFLYEWSSTCGGSIVNRDTILTACHCLTNDEKIHGNVKYLAKPESLKIVAGTGTWDKMTPSMQTREVRKLVPHPKCRHFSQFDESFVNDVGLIYLKRPLDYTYRVKPVPLPTLDIPRAMGLMNRLEDEGTSCTTVGWGRTVESDEAQSRILKSATVQLLRPDECRRRFCSMVKDHCRTNFEGLGQTCVASPKSSDCYGDSGGPLICNGVVVGTVSYGDRCLPNLPTVHQGLRPILEVLAINNVKVDNPDDVVAGPQYDSSPGGLDRYEHDSEDRPTIPDIFDPWNPPLRNSSDPSLFPELTKVNQFLLRVAKSARSRFG